MISASPQPEAKVIALLPVQELNPRSGRSDLAMMAGKPLFFWVLETLLSLPVIDKVVINTDAELALTQWGLRPSTRVIIRSRPEHLRGEVSINRIIEDDIGAFPAATYFMTHPTNPLLRSSTIISAIERFLSNRVDGSADSLFSVTRIQARLYTKSGTALNHDPKLLKRTSALDPYFEENSNIFLFDTQSFQATNSRIGAHPAMFETPRLESINVDSQEAWFLAESLARRVKSGDRLENWRLATD